MLRRYDDFVSAGEDAAPAGLVVDEQPDGVGNCALITGGPQRARKQPAPAIQEKSTIQLAQSHEAPRRTRRQGVVSAASNLIQHGVLHVPGAWKAGTRYEAVLQMTNPESSSSRPMPDVWMAPLSYQRLDKHHVTFTGGALRPL